MTQGNDNLKKALKYSITTALIGVIVGVIGTAMCIVPECNGMD